MKKLFILIAILAGILLLGYAVLMAEDSGVASDLVDTASDIVYEKVFKKWPLIID